MTLRRAVLTVIGASVLAVTGCTTTVKGTALPAPTLRHAKETPTTNAAPTVPVSDLEAALLTIEEVTALVGGTHMAMVGPITSTSDASTIVDDRTCLGLGSIGDVSLYSNSGWVAMRGNQMTSPGVVQADVTQLLTSFTSAADAAALLQRIRQDWQGCATRRYGFHSSNGNHSFFDTGPIIASSSRIEVLLRQEEDPRWSCSHAITVQNSILLEGRVCLLSKDSSAAVKNLLDQVVAKIPQ
jgi:hypothetical protein